MKPALTRLRRWMPLTEALVAPAGLGLLYFVVILWLLGPLWGDVTTHIIGDADTDAVRGMWGLDHLRRSLLPPDFLLWSHELNYPNGVLALIMPVVSGLATAPAGLLFGPIAGFNITITLLLWASAMSTAFLGWARTESWVAGGLLGMAVPAAPMTLHAVCDGTPEHVAIWLMPVFLGSAILLLRAPSVALGAITGLLAILVVLDSPYHGIYTFLIGLFVLPTELLGPWTPTRRKSVLKSILVAAGIMVAGAVVIGVLFRNFPIASPSESETLRQLRMNATDLHTWWQYDFTTGRARDESLAPTAIPAWMLWPAVVLALAGLPRSLPWLASGMFMLSLSFGLNYRIVDELTVWMGANGSQLGQAIMSVNGSLYDLPGIDSVRFPRRWLVPATLALSIAGADGMGRIERLVRRWRPMRRAWLLLGPALVVACSFAVARAGAQTSAIAQRFPKHSLPDVAFAEWIRDHEQAGAVVLLPQRRPAPKSGKRADLPVFADLSENLSSSDSQYLQVRMARPLMSYPSLKTLVPLRLDSDIQSILRNWDDIALPVLSDRDIPSSAIDPRFAPQRQRIIDGLRRDGLGFVVVDEVAYGESGLEHLRTQLADHLADTRHFDDGTGVTVFVLR
ncbi:MAG: hypothetical protein CL927_12585 [Deltaproteobacteria bacterium]|nr:hypothetical protein [Deltaproteobacteria bacterium]HCH61572.1 hypothetical protein [Deltaproteobacteria bacterium]